MRSRVVALGSTVCALVLTSTMFGSGMSYAGGGLPDKEWGKSVGDQRRRMESGDETGNTQAKGGGGVPSYPPGFCTEDPDTYTTPAQQREPHECGYQPPDDGGVDTVTLAQRAWAKLGPPPPAVQTAPPKDKKMLVGMPTWFWLARSQWEDRSDTAHAGRNSVTITASAAHLIIDPGDGSDPTTCTAPGTPYAAETNEEKACTHAYDQSGTYTVRVTTRWNASWTGSDGDTGNLPTLGRSTTFHVTVVESRSELIDGDN